MLFLFTLESAYGQEWGNMQVSYIREVGNPLFLSDFQLGSEETIIDKEGHGISIGHFFLNENSRFFLLNLGLSETSYVGTIEDGVNVGFQPKPGTGFDSLSESKNILYDFDLHFSNPFISISYTNWIITRESLKSNFLLPSTYGIGLIFQNSKGNIIIKDISGVQIAEATYESGTRRYASMGWEFNFEFLYFSMVFRYVESPVLKIESCNADAIGDQACSRFFAATGNRNVSTTLFTGGVLSVGVIF